MRRLLVLAAVLVGLAVAPSALAASPGMIATSSQSVAACPDSDGFSQLDPLVSPGPDCTLSAHKHIVAGFKGLDSDTTFQDQLDGVSGFVIPGIKSAGWWPQWKYDGVVTGKILASGNAAGAAARSKGAAFYYRRKGAPSGVAVQPFGPMFGGMILKEGAVINGELVNRGEEIIFKCGPGSTVDMPLPPTTCSTNILVDNYIFPNCWNGQAAVDQIAAGNMSYPIDNKCPLLYPINVLRVEQFRRSVVPQYQLGAAVLDPSKFTLGDHAVTDAAAPHADYRPAFDEPVMTAFLRDCANFRNTSGVIVGKDCGTNPSFLVALG